MRKFCLLSKVHYSIMKILSLYLFLYLCVAIKSHGTTEVDKLVLSPVELIDLVSQEKQYNSKSSLSPSMGGPSEQPISLMSLERANIMRTGTDMVESNGEPCEDEHTLKTRKVWSRWSKWGECSVTCGDGLVARHRVCVAGRCAPGEFEEQMRPCLRTPCATIHVNVPDDTRDLE